METREGRGIARGAWDSYARAVNRAARPILEGQSWSRPWPGRKQHPGWYPGLVRACRIALGHFVHNHLEPLHAHDLRPARPCGAAPKLVRCLLALPKLLDLRLWRVGV